MNGKEQFVGVVTWYASGNYGTNLQAYALVRAIRDMGFESGLIAPMHLYSPIMTQKLKNMVRPIYRKFRPLPVLNEETERFVRDDLPVIHVKTKGDYARLLQHTLAFVTGSDQVWNPYYLNTFNMLDFIREGRKVAYAASVGVSHIPRRKAATYQKLLPSYSAIGLREWAGIEALGEILPNLKVRKVVDPTLLLDAEDWRGFSVSPSEKFDIHSPYMLCYLVGGDHVNADHVHELWASSGVDTLYVVPSAENPAMSIVGANLLSRVGPREFVGLINGAEFVFTDSFHATAMCINLGKPFMEFIRFAEEDQASQNSRIYELLQGYGLSSRLWHPGAEVMFDTSDLNRAKRRLEVDRVDSSDFLNQAICGIGEWKCR